MAGSHRPGIRRQRWSELFGNRRKAPKGKGNDMERAAQKDISRNGTWLFSDGWQFLLLDTESALEDAQERQADFCPVRIPHDWLIGDSTRLYEDGKGWYRKDFFWEEEGKRAFLIFEGVYMDSEVYVNGRKAGEWKYGYSSFNVEITHFLQKGRNRVWVSACYRNPNSRWYSGAGIYRDVWLKVTEPVCIEQDGIYISSVPEGEDFRLRLQAEMNVPETEYLCGGTHEECGGASWESADSGAGLSGSPAEPQEDLASGLSGYRLEHALYDAKGRRVDWELLSRTGTAWEYLVKKPGRWDVDDPALYTVRTELWKGEKLCQREENRIGFRSVTFSPDEGFLLNGRKLKLNGVCEHHDLGSLGAAFSPRAMQRKLRILREMGVNALRCSHNMAAPGLLDLADEMGFLLISEAFDMWERPKTEWDYARFFPEWHERDVKSWIMRDRNHPSVILWSIGNEIYDTHADGRGQEITRHLKELVERYDPYHNASVTIASNYMPWENAQKCADIVKLAGYNYAERYYEAHHREHPDWVIYGSETSSIVQSRGIYHFPLRAQILSDDDRQCSALGNSATSWSARSMEECISMDRDTDFSMGQFLWTGFDYIGEPTPYHTKNSYFGQVDTAGFPKDSYYVWQSAWTDGKKKPMIHIFPYWDFNPGQIIDVRVCTNAARAELFLNGRSLGVQTLDHAPGSGQKLLADYSVPYEEGVLEAVAYDETGREVARACRQSFGDSAKLVLVPEKEELLADGEDLLFVEIGTLDGQGRPVENACDRVFVEVTGDGALVGLDNGDSTDYDSYQGVSRRLFGGKLLAVIRADRRDPAQGPGEIRMRVTGQGLQEAVLRCACVPGGPERALSWEAVCAAEQGDGPDALCPVVKEENRERPVLTGSRAEIPARKLLLTAPQGQRFTADVKRLTAEAKVLPAAAQDQEVVFAAVNERGVVSNLVKLEQEGRQVRMEALGDGAFYLRCMSKSGTDAVRLISQLEFSIEGLGPASFDPYKFISGSLYTSFKGEVTSGNERGVASARDGETRITYSNIDFGSQGSDRITVPIFSLGSDPCPIQIWQGVPEEGGRLLLDAVYQRESIWNVYQPETWRLPEKLTGLQSISFVVHQKIHIKGFSFAPPMRAWEQNPAAGADAVYGDSYRISGQSVEEIGNNVSLVFRGMDFGEKGAGSLTIRGRAPKGKNTIHVRFFDGQTDQRQIVEFPCCEEARTHVFSVEPMPGSWEVSFVFLPGSCFDFEWFRFG